MNRIMRGALAGAAGTVALDAATYTDMALRRRGSSGTPAALVGVLADKLGLASLGTAAKDETSGNRRSGLGALLGYATGVAVGVAYGMVRDRRGEGVAQGTHPPAYPGSLLAGVAVGLAAMAASDVPIAAAGVSDPRTWGVSDWASDAIPHLVYGLVTVAAYDAIGR